MAALAVSRLYDDQPQPQRDHIAAHKQPPELEPLSSISLGIGESLESVTDAGLRMPERRRVAELEELLCLVLVDRRCAL